ncbi:hypothetical protein ACX0G7_10220 [Flavitalea antarctica]
MKPIKSIIPITLTFLGILFLTSAIAQVISGKGSYSGAPGFERGYQATTYCGNWPESWIRGSAFLDKNTGVLTIRVGLETDALFAGPSCQVLVYITDANGNLLAQVATASVGRGGKAPGRAERTDVQASMHLSPSIVSNASYIRVEPKFLGFVDRWFNVPLQDVYDTAGNLITAAMFFF